MHTFCNCCHKSVHVFYWYFNGVHFNNQMLSPAIHEDMKEAILQKNDTPTSICYVNFYLQWSLYSKPIWIINRTYFCVLRVLFTSFLTLLIFAPAEWYSTFVQNIFMQMPSTIILKGRTYYIMETNMLKNGKVYQSTKGQTSFFSCLHLINILLGKFHDTSVIMVCLDIPTQTSSGSLICRSGKMIAVYIRFYSKPTLFVHLIMWSLWRCFCEN